MCLLASPVAAEVRPALKPKIALAETLATGGTTADRLPVET